MEEKTTKRVRRKKRRLALPVMAVLATASVIAAVGLIYNILEKSENPLITNQPDVSLPNFVGMTVDEAMAEKSFNYEVEYVYNSEYAEDTVISQKPTAPRTVKQNSLVMLKVSKGVMTSIMPDLAKQPKIQAELKLAELGVDVYIKMEETDEFPEGLVIKTEPEAGVPVSSGDVVTIYIAVEEISRTRVVPHVVGLDVAKAKEAINTSGLRVKVVETVNEQPAGTVIWQNHGAGVELAVGSVVEIHVSLGPQ
ncbi:MAG: PASTA domain-containing protein [Oscillospiraceae bacterium]|nr:PASTA domain-containing protein [Oscillospiraceae bacterium]